MFGRVASVWQLWRLGNAHDEQVYQGDGDLCRVRRYDGGWGEEGDRLREVQEELPRDHPWQRELCVSAPMKGGGAYTAGLIDASVRLYPLVGRQTGRGLICCCESWRGRAGL